nr:mucin-5AC isoform X2 [Ipomoea batatas]
MISLKVNSLGVSTTGKPLGYRLPNKVLETLELLDLVDTNTASPKAVTKFSELKGAIVVLDVLTVVLVDMAWLVALMEDDDKEINLRRWHAIEDIIGNYMARIRTRIRSATPSSYATLPSIKSTGPPRSSTPNSRSTAGSLTPTTRPSIPRSKPTSKALTLTRLPK